MAKNEQINLEELNEEILMKLYLAFYEKPRTIVEVEKLTGCSRTTIYNYLKKGLDKHITTPRGYRFNLKYKQGNPLYSKPDLLVKWVIDSSGLDLNSSEISSLKQILDCNFIRTHILSWEKLSKILPQVVRLQLYLFKALDNFAATRILEHRKLLPKSKLSKEVKELYEVITISLAEKIIKQLNPSAQFILDNFKLEPKLG